MWWVWLVPGLAIAGALLATAASAREAWQRLHALRSALSALHVDLQGVQALVARVEQAAPKR